MTGAATPDIEPDLWRAQEALSATGAAARGAADWTARGVSIDTRTLVPGDLFVALSGPTFDGHDYVGAAFKAGAAACVVSRRVDTGDPRAPLLVVNDTFLALRALAVAARERAAATRIAVTGSVGKTGTKDAIARALAAQAPTHATQGNLNNDIGTPLTLARMPAATRYGVFELGMNHAGELTALSSLVRPQVAVITAIGPVHLEFFESVAAIARAKAEIFAGLVAGGTAVVNRDDEQYPILAEAAAARDDIAVMTFGAHGDADMRLLAARHEASGSAVTASLQGSEIRYRIGAPGRHLVVNSLAVIAAVAAAGADPLAAAQSLADIGPRRGRGEVRRLPIAPGRGADAANGGDLLLIDDSYNANPVSMRAAFDTLGLTTPSGGGRRIAVLGDMLELGPRSEDLHIGLGCGLKQAAVDLVFCAGRDMAALYRTLPEPMRGAVAADSAALAPLVAAAVRPGDVVLVKGSLGSRMSRIVAALTDLAATSAEREHSDS